MAIENPRTIAAEAISDNPADSEYHFLDVGGQKYGECTLVRVGQFHMLIDGSHEKDFRGQAGYRSIPAQLEEIFGHPPPFNIDVLVVTHCHADHIGCLPALVSNDIVKPSWALITDPKLGFGRTRDDDNAVDLASDRTRALAAVLREEDVSDLPDRELEEFIDATASVESKYEGMVESLRRRNVDIVPYEGRAIPTALRRLLERHEIRLLGPSEEQLLLAAEQISLTNEDASDSVDSALSSDAGLSNVELYRRIVADDQTRDGGGSRGSAMNCQSITFACGPPGARVLLAGDMQFTEPGVRGADDEVARLRRLVTDLGPYRVYKTTHHTSHNGQDDDLLTALGNPPIIVHSGGLRDPGHPFPGVLKMLKARRARIKFARTDRNGHITVKPDLAAIEDALKISRGRLNDFTDNVVDDLASEETGTILPIVQQSVGSGAQVVIVNLPAGAVDMTVAGVRIVVRGAIDAGGAGGDPQPEAKSRERIAEPARSRVLASTTAINFADGRKLRPLLFVTDTGKLEANIGREEAAAATAAIKGAGHVICETGGSTRPAVELVRTRIRDNPNLTGIVILGGYDVVECPMVDVLSPDLRAALGSEANLDSDGFKVWCDEPYGDLDGDHVSERPISRIPDAHDSTLFLTALQARAVVPDNRFGVSNIERPFAKDIWRSISGAAPMKVSEKFLSSGVTASDTAGSLQYFMLHGSDSDATRFTGEFDGGGGSTRAFDIEKVPPKFSGIVFSGCCFGALTVSQKAAATRTAKPVPRLPQRSIALSYLLAGANAFIGCTGSHYSGKKTDPDLNYASRLHTHFWELMPRLENGPAMALFAARRAFGDDISRRASTMDSLDVARRLKNRTQFTCLGLGW